MTLNRVPVSHDVAEYIALADVCCATFEDNDITRAKSPLKIAEYLASGKPVVASDVGEVKKMIEGAGLLIPPGDAKGTAEGIIMMLKDENKRFEFGKKAREKAEKTFNWQRTSANIMEAYNMAIES